MTPAQLVQTGRLAMRVTDLVSRLPLPIMVIEDQLATDGRMPLAELLQDISDTMSLLALEMDEP